MDFIKNFVYHTGHSASGEGTLRSTIAQTTLTSLATLSIENAIAQNLDFSELIKVFADKKSKKIFYIQCSASKITIYYYFTMYLINDHILESRPLEPSNHQEEAYKLDPISNQQKPPPKIIIQSIFQLKKKKKMDHRRKKLTSSGSSFIQDYYYNIIRTLHKFKIDYLYHKRLYPLHSTLAVTCYIY
ncbi:zinc finger MYM-type protein 1-like [Aphis craccivora]|uniref:Zinc finger MYM-type protein 1-like n=1 Tax=Aphis craccivora TaxID=307492 RepID=A0A6G0YJX1_APHCR|nr:zinc finger MYM-type protein 1-like [Aphis craccivora]